MRTVRTAKDCDGNIIGVGSRVQPINPVDGELLPTECVVVSMIHKGYDGVILTLDRATDLACPSNFTHTAKETRRVGSFRDQNQ